MIFKLFFCRLELNKIALLEGQISKLEADLDKEKKKTSEEEKKKNLYLEKYTNISRDNETLEKLVETLREEKDRLIETVKELQTDIEYYEKRIEKLLAIIEDTITIPDISEYVKIREIIKPYDIIKGYNLTVGDLEYYAFPLEAWKQILALVHPQVKKILGKWIKEVGDCDDWALIMQALVVAAIVKTGLDKQGAFFITWSLSHAYNAFVVTENSESYIYEPQSGIVKGKLGETVKPYDARLAWFPGSKEKKSLKS